MKALIDGDIVLYRCAASAEDSEVWIALSRVDTLINEILDATEADEYSIYVTGERNFRYDVYPEYKANRIGKPRPRWEKACKQYLIDQWDALVSEGCEADDSLGVEQSLAPVETTILCSIDKDLNQIPGWHYNFVKKEKYFVTPEEGIRYFYYQMLVGDTTDNIKGVPGIGPKKAEGLLLDCPVEELYSRVREMYSSDEEMLMNGQCLWIWKKPNDIWRLNDAASGQS